MQLQAAAEHDSANRNYGIFYSILHQSKILNFQEKSYLGSKRGAPSRPLRTEETVPGRNFSTSAGRGRGRGGYSNFREKMKVAGAGGPGALQTSPPARRQKSVDTNPHAALSGLTCRASPANSSIAGGAALDSVRLRRNRSLLLSGTQSSPLTCARGAYRAWAREKAGLL